MEEEPSQRATITAEIFTLCQFSKTDRDGYLYIIGTYDQWIVPSFPYQLILWIGARLRFDQEGKYWLKLSAKDADSNLIAVLGEIPLEIQFPGDASTGTFAYGVHCHN